MEDDDKRKIKLPIDHDDWPWGKFLAVEGREAYELDKSPEGIQIEHWVCPLLYRFWTWTLFPDSTIGECTECKRQVIYRAGGAANAQNAPKLCTDCAKKMINEDAK